VYRHPNGCQSTKFELELIDPVQQYIHGSSAVEPGPAMADATRNEAPAAAASLSSGGHAAGGSFTDAIYALSRPERFDFLFADFPSIWHAPAKPNLQDVLQEHGSGRRRCRGRQRRGKDTFRA
jgi:hypothetical protein